MWEDFPHLDEDGRIELEAAFESYFRALATGSSGIPQNSNTTPRPDAAASRQTSIQFSGAWIRRLARILRTTFESTGDPENGSEMRQRTAHERRADYLLTCVNSECGLPVLKQCKYNDVDSDREYFAMLKRLYEASSWCGRRWLSLKKVVGINYVQVSDAV